MKDVHDYKHDGSESLTARRQLDFMQAALNVRRFHADTMIQPPNVGMHSAGVAYLCWLLTAGAASAALLLRALTHDFAECWTGDMPAPTKQALLQNGECERLEDSILLCNVPQYAEAPINQEEQRILHLADSMQGMLECVRERSMGNQHANIFYDRWLQKSQQYFDVHNTVEFELFAAIQEMWAEVRQ